MKIAIIIGATGMVGGLVLRECLNNLDIEKVTSLVRRPSGIKHYKLTELIVSNFLDFSKLENYFADVDIAYFCIGVYTGAVSRDEFRKITIDYTVAFADALKKHNPNARFCFLSGAGADQSEKSRMMFAKDKGIAENYLIREFKNAHIFRPGYIYPVTPRKEPNFTYRLSRKLYPLLKKMAPNSVITSEQLAKAMFTVGLLGGEKLVLENVDIKNVGVGD